MESCLNDSGGLGHMNPTWELSRITIGINCSTAQMMTGRVPVSRASCISPPRLRQGHDGVPTSLIGPGGYWAD